MNPDKVQRSKLNTLTDLPNVGKAVAEDLVLLGITQPQDLAGQDAYEMYDPLCSLTATRHDRRWLILCRETNQSRGGILRNSGKRF